MVGGGWGRAVFDDAMCAWEAECVVRRREVWDDEGFWGARGGFAAAMS